MQPDVLARALQIRQSGAESEGSGLGLAIVEAQASDHGWRFELDTTPGRGTSAYLTIPA